MESILIIGSGGREHALGWKLAQSSHVKELFFAPGNGGTHVIGTNVSLNLKDHAALVDWVCEHHITYVVVAPDGFLAEGMVDSLEAAGVACFGPTKGAAKIEWSKAYAKEIMDAAHIPTARYASFVSYDAAKAYALEQPLPLVVKASGLAAGKGVVIAQTHEEALATLKDFMLDLKHGESGSEVVIEEFLQGREFSTHAWCDGEHAVMFPAAQDHKRIYNNDEGPNTGGMGTIAPLPWVTDADIEAVKNTIVIPLLQELKKRGSPFRGLLYPGLMMTTEGPKVIEFNARFGDPETQSYMRLLESDLYEAMQSTSQGTLQNTNILWSSSSVACVILASRGYPVTSENEQVITGIETAEAHPDIMVFHAGTKLESDGVLKTNGGRVLNVTAVGETLEQALQKAYSAVPDIQFDGMQYRTDIGAKSLR